MAIAGDQASYVNVLESTRGIMFMGTPHDGADVAKLASTIANIASSVTTFNMTNLNLLQPGSEPLTDISRKFGFIAQKLRVVTVVESNKTLIPYLRKSIQASFHLSSVHEDIIKSV